MPLSTLKLPRKEKQSLREIKQNLKDKLGDNLLSLRLYGSKARGTWKPWSDTDLFIVVKNKKDEDKAFRIAYRTGEKHGLYNIEPLVYNKERWEKMRAIPTLLMQFIDKEGIDI